jgi:hypothetical protein
MSNKVAGLWSLCILITIAAIFIGCSEKIDRRYHSNNTSFEFIFFPFGRLVGETPFATYSGNDFNGVFVANDRFFASFGSADDFITSTNGTSWKWPPYLAASTGIVTEEIFYNLGYYFVLANDGTDTFLRVSDTNGSSYLFFSYLSGMAAKSIALVSGLAVMVGTDSTGSAMQIYTGTNLLSWSARTPGAGGTGTTLNKVIFGGSRFVAVGNNGEIQVSTAGTIWANSAPDSAFSGTFWDVAYGNGLYVAVGHSAAGAAEIQTSADGITWDSQTSALAQELYGVSFNGTRFIAVGTDGIQYSTNGTAWTAATVGGGYTGVFRSVSCNGSLCIAVGDDGEIQSSSSAASWTHITGPAMTEAAVAINGVASNGSRKVIVGSGGLIQTSTNASSWQNQTPAAALSTDLNAVTYGSAAGYVTVGDAGVIQSSTNGATWVSQTAGGAYAGNFSAVTYASSFGKYVAVGAGGEIQNSNDAITWTSQTSGATNYTGVTASPTLVAIVGPGGVIKTSPDLTAWTARAAGGGYAGNFNGVAYGNSLFAAVGDTGEIQTSSDGITWTTKTVAGLGTADLFAVTYNAGFFYAVGENGTMVKSLGGTTWTLMDSYDETTNSIISIGGDSSYMAAGLATFGGILTGDLN